MPANIQVMGVTRAMGGLKESQNEFRKHNGDVAVALLNVAEGMDKEDPRPMYIHQEFPFRLYHADGREADATDQEHKEFLLTKGYRVKPFPKAQVALEDPKTEKLILEKQLKEKDGQIASLGDLQRLMQDRLEALEAKLAESAPASAEGSKKK